jgi:mono/diheme cytochrome c family protein
MIFSENRYPLFGIMLQGGAMQRRAAILIVLLGLAAGQAVADQQSFDAIERGHYLAIVGDCAPCHTAPGGKPYAGGRKIETPFGTLISSNITPDRETGIGAWTDDEFLASMQEGTGRDGRHLYPAMPYTYYTRVTREDALAIRAYLATLDPVRNDVTSNLLPFPFNIRASMTAWNALSFSRGRFEPTAGKSEQWNRGAYLVQGLGHCGACHTAKNFFGADKTSRALKGGELQGWYAPNLTDDPRIGLGSWSVDAVVSYLKTGHNDISAASGPMAEVVAASTSQMTDADLKAMAIYLKDHAPLEASSRQPVSDQDRAMRAGQAVYLDNCAPCHSAGGTGIAKLFSALKESPSVLADDPISVIRVVLQGAQSVATDAAPTGAAMPAHGWKLTDDEVAAVVTYIRNSWGNAASAVSASDVKSARRQFLKYPD